MSSRDTLRLSGCAPIPLAHYLKALGILRLVTERQDSTARGFWNEDVFHLDSSLDAEALTDFFLNRYEPTPILAPWNGGSGFYFQEEKLKEKDPATGKRLKSGRRIQPTAATRVVDAILKSMSSRFVSYRAVIEITRATLAKMQLEKAPEDQAKDKLIAALRAWLPENAVEWLDCVSVLTADPQSEFGLSAIFPPLLGTGGNDGNTDFTSNFMQRLREVISLDTGEPMPKSETFLAASLFGTNTAGTTNNAAIGQFFPGAAGGANNSSGFEGKSAINPWDFILLIEGAVVFAAAAVRKLEFALPGNLAYPFCVRQAGVGYGSASIADENHKRPVEMWMPLWDEPTTLSELQAVLGEGRSQVAGRPARNGVDFTRAVVTLGVDRGLSAFQRYGFQVRNGLAYFATPLDRVVVRRNARADLLSDIDAWLGRFRSKAGLQANPSAPASATRALTQLDASILELCKNNSADSAQAVLVALGSCERAMARSCRWATADNVRLRPIFGLTPRWLCEANNGSVEFRLAAALASISGNYGGERLPLRCHLEPVTIHGTAERPWVDWAENRGNDIVWRDTALVNSLNAILARRLIRAVQFGARGLPDSSAFVHLADIAAFIEGATDDALLSKLLWGLGLVDWAAVQRDDLPRAPEEAQVGPSSLYALLKLCLRKPGQDEDPIPIVSAIHLRATQGDGAAASAIAARRLRASGLAPAVQCVPLNGAVVRRTAAALLFPLSSRQIEILQNSVLRATSDATNP
jgi:CRISPR-associated protein Csx17